jgi:uncharacterized protein (DUF1501 family)
VPNRRSFLNRSVGVAVLGGIMPAGFMSTAWADPLPTLGSSVDPDNVLVVVQMAGGNDGLNTVVPYSDDQYHRVRPVINIPANAVLKINDRIGLNPALAGLNELYKEGKLALIQGVSYPNPNRSHFEATQIWETASVDRPVQTGWLGRYLDATNPQGKKAPMFGAVSLGDTLPAALVANHTDVPAIGQLNSYAYQSGKNTAAKTSAGMLYDGAKPGQSPYLAMIEETARNAYHGGDQLRAQIAGYTTTVTYPKDGFAQQLKLAAQLIGSKTGTRIIFVSLGSFDTHSGQRAQQDRLLGYLGGGLKAFYDDLEAHGNDKRVLTMTFSEFGRRVTQNASNGTDHGTAAPVFVLGGALKGGVYGEHPSLTNLDKNGDLLFSQDFRSVYATVIERWMGRSSTDVLAGTFAPMTFV